MYCRPRPCHPFAIPKQLSHLIPSKLFRFGVVRVGLLHKSRAEPLRGCSTAIFGSLPFANSGLPRCQFDFARENSAEQRIRSLRRKFYSCRGPRERRCSAMGVADEEGVARRLWTRFKNEAVRATYNPFVVALAAGSLNIESFRHYIAQDAYFLKAFAQAYTIAEDCADDDDAKASISKLRKAVEEELKLHNSLAKAWGVELVNECSPNMATVKYTEFLLATAAGKVEGGRGLSRSETPFEKTKIAAYTVGAMTPCMRLYAFLGQEVSKAVGTECNDHPYKQWIETYSSANFEESALQTEELLDKLTISLTGEELEVLGRLYYHSLKLELEFFSSQPFCESTQVPLLKVRDSANYRYVIVSDFDLSCTVSDSSAVLAEIGILSTLKAEQNGAENLNDRKSSFDLKNSWDTLSSQYFEEYEQCVRNILSSEEVDVFDYEGLCRSLEQLSEFEVEANGKVVNSGVLQGLSIDDIKKAGQRLEFQDGCMSFFQQMLSRTDKLNVEMHILSVCWSGDIIRAAFSSDQNWYTHEKIVLHVIMKLMWKLSRQLIGFLRHQFNIIDQLMVLPLLDFFDGGLDGLNVHSNELNYVESVSTGEIDRRIQSPVDKVKVFNNILNCRKENGVENLSIYIGDSVGDLLCLLQADIGIVIGTSSNLRRIGKHFGVSFVPLFSGLLKKGTYVEGSAHWTGLNGTLYTVSSWTEIHAFLLGTSNSSQAF